MKKWFALVLAALLVMTALTAVAEFEPMTMRFGTTSGESTMYVQYFKKFAEKVSAATDGAVSIEVYPGSVLGSSLEMLQSTQLGALDIVVVQPAACADLGVKQMGVLSLPYLFENYDHYYRVLTGEIGQKLLDAVTDANIGLVGFGYYPDGARHYFTTEKGGAIRSVEDIKGKKLRIQSYAIDQKMAEALGFAATPVSISELYSSLQSGVVDGAEQPLSTLLSNKYYEVCKYVTLDAHSYNIPTLLFSATTWNRCSDELKTIMHTAWDECLVEMRPEIEGYQLELINTFRENGMEVIEVTDGQAWADAMKPVYDEFAVGLESLVEEIKAAK
ncbi:MAG: TRAP transporter substrate-binding protein [Candidatus Ventricola sp.]